MNHTYQSVFVQFAGNVQVLDHDCHPHEDVSPEVETLARVHVVEDVSVLLFVLRECGANSRK